jgi:hypothetical protein
MPQPSDFRHAECGTLRGKCDDVLVICVAVLIALFLVQG